MSTLDDAARTVLDGTSPIATDFPLVNKEARFWSCFMLASNKEKRCAELERALNLFIYVLRKYEQDDTLRDITVENAEGLLERVRDIKALLRNGAGVDTAEFENLQKSYEEDIVGIYGATTTSQFEGFQEELKRLWKASGGRHTSFAVPPASNKPKKTIRKMVSQALFSTLTKTMRRVAGAVNRNKESFRADVSSDAETDLSAEASRATSDDEQDIVTFESQFARNLRLGTETEADLDASLIEEELVPPRGSGEWRRGHRVQLSQAGGHFRLIRGRREMDARRDSYNTGDEISPVNSAVIRPESSIGGEIPPTHSTQDIARRVGVRPSQVVYRSHSPGGTSEMTGNVSFYTEASDDEYSEFDDRA